MYNFRHNCRSSFMLPRFQMPRSMAHKSSRLSLSEVTAGLSDPAVKGRLAEVAATPMPFTPPEISAYVAGEIDKWAKVIREAKIKVD